MKICFYALREFDELEFCKKYSEEYNIDFIYTTEYPNKDNVMLAKGCDAISATPCDMSAEMVEAFKNVEKSFFNHHIMKNNEPNT